MSDVEGDAAAMNRYIAMIWTDQDKPGRRVGVVAQSLKQAKEKLEAEYGEGKVFDLHNEDDAARPRRWTPTVLDP